MEIKDYYIDGFGKRHSVKTIEFESDKELFSKCGKSGIKETYLCGDTFSFEDDAYDGLDGVYVHMTKVNPNIAYRIYKNYFDKNACRFDHLTVSALKEKQDKIKLTEFPTGILTVQNKIVGQEIPYYVNSCSLPKSFNTDEISDIQFKYLLEIVEALKELYKEEIIYKDVHSGNFIVDTLEQKIRIIDFEWMRLNIKNYTPYYSKSSYEDMIHYLKVMLLMLNEKIKKELLGDFKNAKTLEEVEESIHNHEKSLIKK